MAFLLRVSQIELAQCKQTTVMKCDVKSVESALNYTHLNQTRKMKQNASLYELIYAGVTGAGARARLVPVLLLSFERNINAARIRMFLSEEEAPSCTACKLKEGGRGLLPEDCVWLFKHKLTLLTVRGRRWINAPRLVLRANI